MKSVAKLTFLLLALVLPRLLVAEPVYGEVDGAPYALWAPAAETDARILLIIAPGYRPVDAPREARLDPTDPTWQALHEAGWTLAATAYRRGGWVLPEGITDVAALAAHLESAHGPYRLTFAQGSSMGGLLVTQLLEDTDLAPRFSGALALGAALEVTPDRLVTIGAQGADLTVQRAPLRPILYVSNRNELGGPLAYLAAVAAGTDRQHRVAVHVIDRPGHVNVSPAERAVALRLLHHWAEGEPPALLGDVTVPTVEAVSSGEVTDGGLVTRVMRIDPDFGNVDLDATFADLLALGLDFGSVVGVRPAAAPDAPVQPVLITDRYNAVPRGDWVLVVLPDGHLRLAINHGNVSAALGTKLETALAISPLR